MKNTVIFDLDGLLIDSEVIFYQLYHDLAAGFNQSFSVEEYTHGYCGKTERDNMRRLIMTHHLPVSVDEGLILMALREKEYLKKGISLKYGARELLSYLKRRQYKIVLASSSSRERAVSILSRNGIGDFFDHMVFGTDVERGKPYPDIFSKACEYADELPESCLVLEDSEAGIQAAFAAGIEVICIPDMKVPGREFWKMETAELSSLEDVIFWLEKLQAEGAAM